MHTRLHRLKLGHPVLFLILILTLFSTACKMTRSSAPSSTTSAAGDELLNPQSGPANFKGWTQPKIRDPSWHTSYWEIPVINGAKSGPKDPRFKNDRPRFVADWPGASFNIVELSRDQQRIRAVFKNISKEPINLGLASNTKYLPSYFYDSSSMWIVVHRFGDMVWGPPEFLQPDQSLSLEFDFPKGEWGPEVPFRIQYAWFLSTPTTIRALTNESQGPRLILS
jgi:hypothetical protein